MTDGHCAIDAESIYVQNNTSICTTTASSSGGIKTQPFCSMEPVVTALAPGRDLVVVNGTSGAITEEAGPTPTRSARSSRSSASRTPLSEAFRPLPSACSRVRSTFGR